MKFLLLIAGCLLTITLSAQTFSGRITNTSGDGIPSATLYLFEISQGLVTNEYGEFQLQMKKGDYTCEISCLGYEKKKINISIPQEGLSLNIELTEKTYGLKEVIVTPSKEDPAYRIMRNVIAHAPYHLHQIEKYESDVYMKGNFKVEKIPALLKMQIKKEEKEFLDMIGKLYVYESQSKIKYNKAPKNEATDSTSGTTNTDKYELHVLAISSSIPEDFGFDDDAPLGIIKSNIYHPSTFGGLLAPGSFSVYKFALEDTYRENDLLISKIRVIPRKKNAELVEGWIYIVNDTWNVQQANLTMSQLGITLNFNGTYHEIKPEAFLLSSLDVDVKVNVIGVKAGGHFYASIKYDSLQTTNDYTQTTTEAVSSPDEITKETTKQLTKKQQKDIKKLDELSSKENLTTREAYKMAELVQKTFESEEEKKQKQSLEIKRINNTNIITRDSLAHKRDSSYWSMTRTIPLHKEEMISYVQRDSISRIAESTKSTETTDSLKSKKHRSSVLSDLLLGEGFKIGKNIYISNNGLLLACTEYNFIDGFRIGQKIDLDIFLNKNKSRSLTIAPAVYYTTARKEIDYKTDVILNYASMKKGRLFLSTGNTIADHAGYNGTGRFGNTLGSILFAGNTAKFYQKKYASISNNFDIANGLILTTSFNYENRNDLDNNMSFNFFNKTPNSNRPHGQTDNMPSHEASVANIAIEYTPRYRYTIWGNNKTYIKSNYPTMWLSYKKGFGGKSKINSSFENIEATVKQKISTGMFSAIDYEVNAGLFLSSKKTYLADYKHFRTNEMFLSGKEFNNSFLMDNYRYATNDKWMQAHLNYASQYILLKQIPFMQGWLFDEALHIHSLWTPSINYNEVGYSFGLGKEIRVGVFAGFEKLKHTRTGILISLPLMSSMNK
jgi:hypothetical protein